MHNQRALDKFAVVATLLLLFLTALGNAAVMFAAALIALGIGWALYCKRAARGIAVSAFTGFVVALAIGLTIRWLK
jgi:hypothetical protein